MDSIRKVLIVDKSIDRKQRISAVKQRGFAVFPALKLSESRSRCRPGAYDLIVINASDEQQEAVAFCDELRGRTPSQPVLLVVGENVSAPDRDYVVQEDPESLAARVEAVLGRNSQAPTSAAAGEREETRASA